MWHILKRSRILRVGCYFVQASFLMNVLLAYWNFVGTTGEVDLMTVGWGLALAAMAFAITLP
jgi:hypothetical protein